MQLISVYWLTNLCIYFIYTYFYSMEIFLKYFIQQYFINMIWSFSIKIEYFSMITLSKCCKYLCRKYSQRFTEILEDFLSNNPQMWIEYVMLLKTSCNIIFLNQIKFIRYINLKKWRKFIILNINYIEN